MDTEKKNEAFYIPWTFQWPDKNPVFPGYEGVTAMSLTSEEGPRR
jgi:hypothetical protein